MLNPEGMRRARPQPASLPSEAMLHHDYGDRLEAAAEDFLITSFEQGGHGPLGENGVPPVLVAAAMHVLNRAAWTQPSDEQVKAAMFLAQQAKQSDRPDSDEEDSGGRRAA